MNLKLSTNCVGSTVHFVSLTTANMYDNTPTTHKLCVETMATLAYSVGQQSSTPLYHHSACRLPISQLKTFIAIKTTLKSATSAFQTNCLNFTFGQMFVLRSKFDILCHGVFFQAKLWLHVCCSTVGFKTILPVRFRKIQRQLSLWMERNWKKRNYIHVHSITILNTSLTSNYASENGKNNFATSDWNQHITSKITALLQTKTTNLLQNPILI